MYKLLKISFVLLLILLGELIAYFYFYSNRNNRPSEIKADISTNKEFDCFSKEATSCIGKLLPSPNPMQGILESNLASLRTLKRGPLQSANIKYILTGQIDMIKKVQNPEEITITLAIKSKDGSMNILEFSNNLTQIISEEDRKILPIEELKAGSYIDLEVEYDLLNSRSIKNTIIKKHV